MEFCLMFPNVRPYCEPQTAASVAAAAEEAGFYAFLVWDHYNTALGPDTLEAWALLAYLAAKTSVIRLGTCVTPIPLRPPAVLAKLVATVDVLSGGRTILGVGAGHYQPEFEGYSQWDDAPVRVSRVKEGLELILRLWRDEKVDFQGTYYAAKGAILAPKPLQKPHPPLWFGAWRQRMLGITAQYGDAWVPQRLSPSQYSSQLKRMQEHRQRLGVQEKLAGAFQALDSFPEPDEYLRSIEQYAEAGCEYYGVAWLYPPEEMVPRLKWFSQEVMARVRS